MPPLAVMEIDTLGTFQMSRAAHPHLKRGGGGVVVNISATLHYGATFYQVQRSESPAVGGIAPRHYQDTLVVEGLGRSGVAPGHKLREAGTSWRHLVCAVDLLK